MVGWLEWVEGGGRPSLGVWGRACERDEGIGDRTVCDLEKLEMYVSCAGRIFTEGTRTPALK